MRRQQRSLSVLLPLIIMLAASMVIVTLAKFGNFGIAQGQGSLTIGNMTITPEQKTAICASVGSHVNTTESRICGIPKSPPSNATTSAENITTTGAGAQSTSLAPPA